MVVDVFCMIFYMTRQQAHTLIQMIFGCAFFFPVETKRGQNADASIVCFKNVCLLFVATVCCVARKMSQIYLVILSCNEDK